MTAHMLAEMTQVEFQEMLENVVEATVERKLLELLGDPDEGFVLYEAVQVRLQRQRERVQVGERGVALTDVIRQLELD